MCGIAGFAHLGGEEVPDARHKLGVFNRLLRHRGPDGEKTWLHSDGRVGLSHVRLSVIDLTTGDQPMHGPNGNTVAANGEIYNYRDLRARFGESSFRTESDTEVVLEAYRRFGESSVEHLRGMFAFALWDEDRQRLFCARARFGIKPFYYTVVGDVFYFASEIKAASSIAR